MLLCLLGYELLLKKLLLLLLHSIIIHLCVLFRRHHILKLIIYRLRIILSKSLISIWLLLVLHLAHLLYLSRLNIILGSHRFKLVLFVLYTLLLKLVQVYCSLLWVVLTKLRNPEIIFFLKCLWNCILHFFWFIH